MSLHYTGPIKYLLECFLIILFTPLLCSKLSNVTIMWQSGLLNQIMLLFFIYYLCITCVILYIIQTMPS